MHAFLFVFCFVLSANKCKLKIMCYLRWFLFVCLSVLVMFFFFVVVVDYLILCSLLLLFVLIFVH